MDTPENMKLACFVRSQILPRRSNRVLAAEITPELLAVYASTPAEQDAWGLMQREGGDDE
jgi:hypothetical protein